LRFGIHGYSFSLYINDEKKMPKNILPYTLTAWLKGYRHMFRFSGRAKRLDFFIFSTIHLSLFYAITKGVIHFFPAENQDTQITLFLIGVFSLIAMLSYNVRRLHDANRSGLLCIGYFLFVAFVVIVVSLLLPPQNTGNRYGPNP
jgi:uncharacterized membrane protein YhaH (DUF805 family)